MKNNLEKILSLPSIDAAPKLLGWVLARNLHGGKVRGIIVETEAYHQDDPASHSFKGQTARTEPMFKAGGHIYVYFTYGTHYCVNIVTGKKGVGEAILIRALEPLSGIELMRQNRQVKNDLLLTNGPGKLTQALGIKNTSMSGQKISKPTISLEVPPQKINSADILASPRIGITQATENYWRFYLKGNPFVSRQAKKPT